MCLKSSDVLLKHPKLNTYEIEALKTITSINIIFWMDYFLGVAKDGELKVKKLL
jgi:hypothetical protein